MAAAVSLLSLLEAGPLPPSFLHQRTPQTTSILPVSSPPRWSHSGRKPHLCPKPPSTAATVPLVRALAVVRFVAHVKRGISLIIPVAGALPEVACGARTAAGVELLPLLHGRRRGRRRRRGEERDG
ncbi:hypothetical protein ACQJBY_060352 [Aegilops geniculata]